MVIIFLFWPPTIANNKETWSSWDIKFIYTNGFHEFWWFDMFCRTMLKICNKQHLMEHMQQCETWHHYKYSQMTNWTAACWIAGREDRNGHLDHPIWSPNEKVMPPGKSSTRPCRAGRPDKDGRPGTSSKHLPLIIIALGTHQWTPPNTW